MNALLIYLLKVIAIQGILYLIYILVFHKSGRHAINRYYVILALVLSFLIPFISVSIPNDKFSEEVVEAETPVWYEIAELTTSKTELIPVKNDNQADFKYEMVFIGITFISLLLLLKLIYSHFQLLRLKRKSERIIKDGLPIFCSKIDSPFSYFRYIFIPHNILESLSFDTILKHELVHVRKWHSGDRIFIELILAVFWFNPFHYLFRNRLIETHEFQADEEVISTQKDPIHYQEILYQQINSRYALATANHFKLNTIKTRIKMINKNKKLSKKYYLLILPLIALITFSFANKEKSTSVAPLKSDVSGVIEDILSSPDNFTPSIFPLKDAEGVKLTSGFGKRMHPILKVERMHEGIDLKTYKGNPVLATADGIVEEVDSVFGGYGKLIRLEHNGIYQTAYAHLSEIKVKKGDQVKRGEIIGAAGTSGRSVEPHLHYQVKEIGEDELDPIDFIKDFDFKKSSSSIILNSNTPSILPLKEADKTMYHTGIGKRVHPITKDTVFHSGLDLKASVGDLVIATADGVVKEAGEMGRYGNNVIIDHAGHYSTSYTYLSEIMVSKGDVIKKGEVIAKAGMTGEATAPHLHYEVKNAEGKILDPIDFITNYDFEINSKIKKLK
ncbi:MAG: peptidoglycan DD-metalloendopeptidase family protein [Bacteroidota bacterium]